MGPFPSAESIPAQAQESEVAGAGVVESRGEGKGVPGGLRAPDHAFSPFAGTDGWAPPFSELAQKTTLGLVGTRSLGRKPLARGGWPGENRGG